MDTFKITNIEGKEIECDVLFVYEDVETHKTYIVFTDHTIDHYGQEEILAFEYLPESSMSKAIETNEEWMMLETILQQLLEGNINVQ